MRNISKLFSMLMITSILVLARSGTERCHRCDSTGYQPYPRCNNSYGNGSTCNRCGGTGQMTCVRCQGEGACG